MRHLSLFLPKHILKTVYYGIFNSRLTYGLMFWGTCPRSSFERVFKLQKRCLRIVCNLGYRESCKDHFRTEEILTLPSLFISAISQFVFKNTHLFQKHNHTYSTRNKNQLVIPAHNTALFEKSVIYLGPKIFNCLPENIQNAPSINVFKSRLRSFLIREAFYTLSEFYSRVKN